MVKIRIKEVPSENKVKSTLKAIPREYANVEVEDAETVIGDINRDGVAEFMEFKGKKHSEGGIPANLPNGSFVYSDAIKITDRNILDYFGVSKRKKSVTPAELSKNYSINEYIDILKRDDTDAISKRTAQMMLDKNFAKLAEIAVVQESLKGFPDGIPTFAKDVLGISDNTVAGPSNTVLQKGAEVSIFSPKEYAIKMMEDLRKDPSALKEAYAAMRAKEDELLERRKTKVGSNNINNYSSVYPNKPFYTEEEIKQLIDINTTSPKHVLDSIRDVHQRSIEYEMTNRRPFPLSPSSVKIPDLNPKVNYTKDIEYYQNFLDKDPYTYFTFKGVPIPYGGFDHRKGLDLNRIVNLKNKVNQEYSGSYYIAAVHPSSKEGHGFFLKKFNYIPERDLSAMSDRVHFTIFPIQGNKIVEDQPMIISGENLAKVLAMPAKKNEHKKAYYEQLYTRSEGGEIDWSGGSKVKLNDDGSIKSVVLSNGKEYTYNPDTKDYELIEEGVVKDRKKFVIAPSVVQALNNKAEDQKWNLMLPKYIAMVDIQPPQQGSVYGAPLHEDKYRDDFIKRHDDFIQKNLGMTAEKFLDEISKPGANATNLVKEFQKKYNEAFYKATGLNYFQTLPGQNPYGFDGKFGWYTWSAPGITQLIEESGNLVTDKASLREYKPKEYQKVIPEERKPFTPDDVNVNEIQPDAEAHFDTWFLPDMLNFMGAVSTPVDKIYPRQSRVELQTPGYTLTDPSRQIAANQEQMARYAEMLERSASPQVALAALLASSGKGLAHAANVLAQYENANANIVNQMGTQAAQIKNQETMSNEAARQKYLNDLAILEDNYKKELEDKKWSMINAYSQGWNNFVKDQLMENVLFPQYAVDNVTGQVRFTGAANRNPYHDVYTNPLKASQSRLVETQPFLNPAFTAQYYQELSNALNDPEMAKDLLKSLMQSYRTYSNVKPE